MSKENETIRFNKEESFHDNWASNVDINDVMVDESFEACTSPENQFILKEVTKTTGKKVLELGCGLGEASVYFAKQGKEVTASDISSEMLNTVKKVAEKHQVSVKTLHCVSDKIDCPDNSFYIIYAGNLLHHVDIENTLKEVSRVLKPNGTFVSWDPLKYNPIINIYRKMATEVRTVDEQPLSMKDIKLIKKYFPNIKTHYTWFFTLFIFIKYYFIDRVDPNKERYWKKVIKEHQNIRGTYLFLAKLDKIVLSALPFLKKYCWNVTIVAKR